MKKSILFYAISLFCLSSSAQITLEHTYANAGYWYPYNDASMQLVGGKFFYMVKLEVSGDKYVSIDTQNQMLTFYNLDHTFFKSISFATVPLSGIQTPAVERATGSIMYISENLFDSDSQIEFMYTYAYGGNAGNPAQQFAITQIFNEDGSVLFTAPGEAPVVKPNYHNQYYPIYNTSDGTKMILSKLDLTAKVYSLGGTLFPTTSLNHIFGENQNMTLFPNPSSQKGTVELKYTLPADVKTADLKVFDNSGKEVLNFKVGNEMDHILIDQERLSSGVYYYVLTSDAKIIGTRKSIVVE